MTMRTTTDGLPYYCVFCGSGWGEYGACEDVRCQLETSETALSRSIPNMPNPPQIGDYSDIMEEQL